MYERATDLSERQIYHISLTIFEELVAEYKKKVPQRKEEEVIATDRIV